MRISIHLDPHPLHGLKREAEGLEHGSCRTRTVRIEEGEAEMVGIDSGMVQPCGCPDSEAEHNVGLLGHGSTDCEGRLSYRKVGKRVRGSLVGMCRSPRIHCPARP